MMTSHYLYQMNLAYKHLLPDNFSTSSRVWIYQSNRMFTLAEALEIESELNDFCGKWHSHGSDLVAYANLFFGQFIVLIADESKSAVSGCSTDTSVRLVKALGNKFAVDFFDRTNLAFLVKDKIQLLPLNQLVYAFNNNFINEETLYFNNLVGDKKSLENDWIIPLKNSWLANRVPITHSSERQVI